MPNTTNKPTPKYRFSIISNPDAPYIDYIKQGAKPAEGRIFSPKYQQLKKGNIISFYNKDQEIVCLITFIHIYKSFKDMLLKEGITNMLPQLKDKPQTDDLLEVAIQVYESFPGSHKVKRYGCVAIGVEYLYSR